MQNKALLFDHLVGAGEQHRRHREAERLSTAARTLQRCQCYHLEGNARKLYVSSGGANVKLKLQFD